VEVITDDLLTKFPDWVVNRKFRRYLLAQGLPPPPDPPDLYGAARLAAVISSKTWDPSASRFTTYAYKAVWYAVHRQYRKQLAWPRVGYSTGRPFDPVESLDQEVMDPAIVKDRLSWTEDEWGVVLHNTSPRTRSILRARMAGRSLRDLAKTHRVTDERVRQIEAAGLVRVRNSWKLGEVRVEGFPDPPKPDRPLLRDRPVKAGTYHVPDDTEAAVRDLYPNTFR
jgi:hypothetical protein